MTRASWVSVSAVLAGLVMVGGAGGWSGRVASAQGRDGRTPMAEMIAPRFELDPSWPEPLPDGTPGPSLYCAVIVKRVDAKTRAKTGINELLRD